MVFRAISVRGGFPMQSGVIHMEIHTLRRYGWSVSAIARNLGLDRATVRRELASSDPRGYRQRARPMGLSEAQLGACQAAGRPVPRHPWDNPLSGVAPRLRRPRQLPDRGASHAFLAREPPTGSGGSIRDRSGPPDTGRLG